MKKQLSEAIKWLNARSARERIFLAAACLTIPVLLWDSALMEPLEARRLEADKKIGSLKNDVMRLEGETEKIAKELSIDLDEENRDRKKNLMDSLTRLHEVVDKRTEDLIPPAEMTRVLKQMLLRQAGLRLVRLESLPVEPLFETPEGIEVDSEGGDLFKHGVVIEVLGDYASTVLYLQAVENLPRRFFWESLDYEVIEYPTARITLTLRSLSTQEGVVGV
jgi:MSHA biogenesis protein MshJ